MKIQESAHALCRVINKIINENISVREKTLAIFALMGGWSPTEIAEAIRESECNLGIAKFTAIDRALEKPFEIFCEAVQKKFAEHEANIESLRAPQRDK